MSDFSDSAHWLRLFLQALTNTRYVLWKQRWRKRMGEKGTAREAKHASCKRLNPHTTVTGVSYTTTAVTTAKVNAIKHLRWVAGVIITHL